MMTKKHLWILTILSLFISSYTCKAAQDPSLNGFRLASQSENILLMNTIQEKKTSSSSDSSINKSPRRVVEENTSALFHSIKKSNNWIPKTAFRVNIKRVNMQYLHDQFELEKRPYTEMMRAAQEIERNKKRLIEINEILTNPRLLSNYQKIYIAVKEEEIKRENSKKQDLYHSLHIKQKEDSNIVYLDSKSIDLNSFFHDSAWVEFYGCPYTKANISHNLDNPTINVVKDNPQSGSYRVEVKLNNGFKAFIGGLTLGIAPALSEKSYFKVTLRGQKRYQSSHIYRKNKLRRSIEKVDEKIQKLNREIQNPPTEVPAVPEKKSIWQKMFCLLFTPILDQGIEIYQKKKEKTETNLQKAEKRHHEYAQQVKAKKSRIDFIKATSSIIDQALKDLE